MRGTPQNIICILTYADDIPPSSCSIIRCDRPQIGNGKKKCFYGQNLFRGSLFRQDTIDDMFVYQSDTDINYLSINSITTQYLFNIASDLCMLYIFSGKPETHRAGNISSRATCWYCIEHFEPGAALPSITNF